MKPMDGTEPQLVKLSDSDAKALDWLATHDWDASNAPPAMQDRARRLLGLLETAAGDRSPLDLGLVEAVCTRLGHTNHLPTEYRLMEADADALDAWLLAGHRSDRVPSVLKRRAAVHDRLSTLLSVSAHHHVDHDLTDRTLDAVLSGSAETVREPFRLRLGARLSDLVSLAAVLLIGASVMLPVLATTRAQSTRIQNESNMAVAGLGFGAYSADNQDRLPARASLPAATNWKWWLVGVDPGQSNSANLYTLHRLGYTPLEALASPGNPDAVTDGLPSEAEDWRSFREVSYSYRLSRHPDEAIEPDAVILADRSPVMLRAYAGQAIRIDENSPNHDGRGQNLLRGDGSVVWTRSPWTESGDHIFLPREIERIIDSFAQGRVLTLQAINAPAEASDAFVAP